MDNYSIHLPSYSIGDKVYDKFVAAGYECEAMKEKNRKLIFEDNENGSSKRKNRGSHKRF